MLNMHDYNIFYRVSFTTAMSLLSPSVVTFGYIPASYSFGEDSGSNDVSVAVISGNTGQFQLSADYATSDGSAIGKNYIITNHSLRGWLCIKSSASNFV